MNYKPGDRVRVKTWEELLATPGVDISGSGLRNVHTGDYFNKGAHWLCGKTVTIVNTSDDGYSIKEDGLAWSWYDWMLTGANVETKPTNMRLNPLDHVATIDR